MIGSFQCMSPDCHMQGMDQDHDWNPDLPLALRQHKCRQCRNPMLLVSVKKPMTEENKQRLKALAARRKEKP